MPTLPEQHQSCTMEFFTERVNSFTNVMELQLNSTTYNPFEKATLNMWKIPSEKYDKIKM